MVFRQPHTENISSDRTAYVWILSFVVFTLFWISRNSVTHNIFGNVDNSWYFTCGKAWMEGLTPYIDFSDSKGPLLWLFYGIAYLISPTSYFGVFLIECLCYSLTFYFIYRTALIFSPTRREALACTLFSSLFFFNSLHFESKAEDFCMPFISASLFLTFSLLQNSKGGGKSRCCLYALATGFCIGACLLVKYNVAAMCLAFAAAQLYIAFQGDKKEIAATLLCHVAGFFLAIFPFFLYFSGIGNLHAFINEYFINTYHTVSVPISDIPEQYFTNEVAYAFSFRKSTYTIYLLAVLSGCFLYGSKKPEHYKFLPFLLCLWFIAIGIRHNITRHYVLSAAPFGVFLILYLRDALRNKMPKRWKLWMTAWLAFFCIVCIWQKPWNRTNFFTSSSPDRTVFQEAIQAIESTGKPQTLMTTVNLPMFDVPDKLLPACRYWILQTGATPEMRASHFDAIKHRNADIVIISESVPNSAPPELLRKSGYRQLYEGTLHDVFNYPVSFQIYSSK